MFAITVPALRDALKFATKKVEQSRGSFTGVQFAQRVLTEVLAILAVPDRHMVVQAHGEHDNVSYPAKALGQYTRSVLDDLLVGGESMLEDTIGSNEFDGTVMIDVIARPVSERTVLFTHEHPQHNPLALLLRHICDYLGDMLCEAEIDPDENPF